MNQEQGPSASERETAKPVIVYAVNGQGRGHAAKALALTEMMEPYYDVRFFAGGEAYDFFQRKGLKVTEIPSLRFKFRNSAVFLTGTILHNRPLIFRYPKVIREVRAKLEAVKPDLVISDFETFVPRAAVKMGIPIYQISHQVVLTHCKYEVPKGFRGSWLKALFVSRTIIGNRFTKAIGVSFFDAPVAKEKDKDRVEILPPIFRQEIMNHDHANHQGEHVLAYFSCPEFHWAAERLTQFPDHQFIVYGPAADKRIEAPNLTYKEISPQGFLEDLLRAKAVITNGGHNFIAEAHSLGLPILSFHVEGQFEQFLNAYYVQQMGLGRLIKDLEDTDAIMKEFFSTLSGDNPFPFDPGPMGNDIILGRIHQILGAKAAVQPSKNLSKAPRTAQA